MKYILIAGLNFYEFLNFFISLYVTYLGVVKSNPKQYITTFLFSILTTVNEIYLWLIDVQSHNIVLLTRHLEKTCPINYQYDRTSDFSKCCLHLLLLLILINIRWFLDLIKKLNAIINQSQGIGSVSDRKMLI